MIRILLIVIGIYLLYRFIFHFIIPVTRVAGTMKKRMQEFQQQMNSQTDAFQQSTSQQAPKEPAKGGDYIEFEEVK
ncbi:hypothetical protein PDL71_02025 [Lacibacter sp. MH-610]|uniref:hypothetical protein n=1 Tax=Lacibacter sp. MH-610 TaxID=3020883 RepID=UPI0038913016